MASCPCCEQEIDHRPYSRLRDGIPSSTAIANMLDDGKSRGFAWAAAGIAASTAVHRPDDWSELGQDGCTGDKTGFCPACRYLRSEFDRQWKAKADLGTHIHHLALSWARGEAIDVDPAAMPYVDALEKFYVDCDPEFVLTESTVLFDSPKAQSYRGQFDFIANLTRDGQRKRGLWDIKSGQFHPTEQTLQLAGYVHAQWLTDWSDGTEQKVAKMPPVEEAGVLLLRPDGTYRLVELPARGDAVGMFLRLREAHRWAKQMDQWKKENPVPEGES